MEKIFNNCPACGKKYNIPKEYIGRKVKCKNCNTEFVVQNQISAVIQTAYEKPVKKVGSFLNSMWTLIITPVLFLTVGVINTGVIWYFAVNIAEKRNQTLGFTFGIFATLFSIMMLRLIYERFIIIFKINNTLDKILERIENNKDLK